jgi:hypothetical protein
MSTPEYSGQSWPLKHVGQSLVESFNTLYESANQLDIVRRVAVDYSLPEGKNIVTLNAWVNKAGAREWITNPNFSEKYSVLGGDFHTKWYVTEQRFHIDEIAEDQLSWNQIARLQASLPTQHGQLALTHLADAINNGTSSTSYPAYIDEASSTKAFFADDHSFGGTTWDNYEDTNTVTAAGNIDTNITNLKNGILNFVKAPDFNGLEAGFGNTMANTIVLYSPNLISVINTIENDPWVVRGGTQYHNPLAGALNSIMVPGLSDDTTVLIRKDDTAGPFIFAHTDPWTVETWRSPGDPYQYYHLRWRWVVIAAECRAAYLLKA